MTWNLELKYHSDSFTAVSSVTCITHLTPSRLCRTLFYALAMSSAAQNKTSSLLDALDNSFASHKPSRAPQTPRKDRNTIDKYLLPLSSGTQASGSHNVRRSLAIDSDSVDGT